MDEDMYFIDTRNADNRVVRPGFLPGRAVAVAPAQAPSRVAIAAPAYATPPAMLYPQAVPQASFFGPAPVYSPGPIYGQSPFMGQLGSLFGGLNLGDVVKLAADAFAAFKALPMQPAPTGDAATDVANEVVYTSALAKDAVTRKQIEFGGEIAGRLGRGLLGVW
jgi:hypothetical protein